MSIGVNARTPGSQAFAAGASGSGVTSVTFTHTHTAFDKGMVTAEGAQDANANSTSCVWDFGGAALPMARLGTATPTGNCRPELYWLRSPSVTGARSIRVTLPTSNDIGFGAASYTGVIQTGATPFNAASPQSATGASGSNPSNAITSAAGEMVIDAFVQDFSASNPTAPTVGAGQSYICAGSVTSPSIGVGASDEAAVGVSTVMSWTVDTTKGAWSSIGGSIKPAPGDNVQRQVRPYPFAPGVPNR